jgi:putative membrane protein
MIPVEEGWQRLHPLTILKEVGSLAWALVAAFVLDLDFYDVPVQAVRTEAVVAVFVFGYAVTRYLFTAYRLTDEALELRRGVLVKSFQSMPRSRVQSVALNTGVVGRFVGVRTVEVSAADSEDINLSFVSESAAEGLRSVLSRRAVTEEGADDAEVVEPLSTLDPGRLLAFGITETAMVVTVLAAVVVVVVTFGLGLFVAPFALLPAAAWPVVRTLALVGFRSWIEDDRLRISAGLVGRRQTETPLARIQVLQVTRPFLRRLVGMETVSVVSGDVAISNETALIAGSVAPFEPVGTWRRIADEVIGHVALGEAQLRRSSRLTIRRFLVRAGVSLLIPVAALAGAAVWLGWGWWPAAGFAAISAAIVVPYGFARWRMMGWAADGRHLLVRRGVFTRRLTVVPIAKVQDLEVSSTFFQRRLGLASVEVDTAGVGLMGSIKTIDLEADDARFLADHLSSRASRIALPDGV